ncbi:MAG: type III-A CRISPR-associated protein Csm2 [Methanosarcinales archaeon]
MRIVDEVKKDLDSILDGDIENLVNNAEKFGKHLAENNMTTSQIRNIFGEVKKIRTYDKYRLNLLRPKLAYTAGRHRNVRDLQEVLDLAIRKVDNEERFYYFKDFFEAILAYHRKYGKE